MVCIYAEVNNTQITFTSSTSCAKMQNMDDELLREKITEGLNKTGLSASRASNLAVGESGAIGRIFDGHKPSFDRACKILRVLGIDLFFSSPQSETWKNEPESSRSTPGGEADPSTETRKNEPDSSTSPVPPWLQEALELSGEADADSVLETVRGLRESGQEAAVFAALCDKARSVDALRERLVQEETAPEELVSVINAETEALHLEIAHHLRPLAEVLDDATALVAVLRPPGAGHGFGELQEMRHAEVQEVNTVAVDVVDMDAAAGGGSQPGQERVIGTLAFCRTWMEKHYLRPRECFVMGVRGESMEPVLHPDSSILVDQNRKAWRPGKIFVVDGWHGTVVKYAGEDSLGNWQLESAHRSHEPIPFPDDGKVVGQVVWTARTIIEHSYVPHPTME